MMKISRAGQNRLLPAPSLRRAPNVSLPPPAFGERGHRSLASRLISVRWRAAFVVREDQGPHPRRSYGRCIGVEDAADSFAVGQHVEIVMIPLAGWTRGRGAFEAEVIL